MHTPVIYSNSAVDPFAHLGQAHKTISTPLFYATNRMPENGANGLVYGNTVSDKLHFGQVTVRMGADK